LDIDAALAALPHDYRVAVVLRDQLGLDYAEIAAVCEIPVGTVRSRLSRGRAALATRLGATGPARADESGQAGNREPAANVEETAP
jgi:RNA polymerase sigma-70 factor (ECF subfamily)